VADPGVAASNQNIENNPMYRSDGVDVMDVLPGKIGKCQAYEGALPQTCHQVATEI
jgi:hypothetical protein